MLRTNLRLALVLVVALLSGCVTAYKLELAYAPEPDVLSALASKTFSLKVTDERPFVVYGEKVPFFLGIARFDYGFPRDVVSKSKTPFATQLKIDLTHELESLGLVESSTPSRQIRIRVRDWNFDTGPRSRFWYDLDLTIANAAGKTLLTRKVKNERVFETNIFDLNRELNRQIPHQYAIAIREIFRDDAKTLTALQMEHQLDNVR